MNKPALSAVVLVAFAATLSLAVADDKPEAAPPAGEASAAPASGSELKVASGLENREPVGVSDHFEVAAGTKIWAWARVRGVEAGTKVTLVFRQGEKERFRQELTIASVPFRTNAFRTFRKGDDGDWSALLLAADGSELAVAKFTVKITG